MKFWVRFKVLFGFILICFNFAMVLSCFVLVCIGFHMVFWDFCYLLLFSVKFYKFRDNVRLYLVLSWFVLTLPWFYHGLSWFWLYSLFKYLWYVHASDLIIMYCLFANFGKKMYVRWCNDRWYFANVAFLSSDCVQYFGLGWIY